jgi:hypothetical protein
MLWGRVTLAAQLMESGPVRPRLAVELPAASALFIPPDKYGRLLIFTPLRSGIGLHRLTQDCGDTHTLALGLVPE